MEEDKNTKYSRQLEDALSRLNDESSSLFDSDTSASNSDPLSTLEGSLKTMNAKRFSSLSSFAGLRATNDPTGSSDRLQKMFAASAQQPFQEALNGNTNDVSQLQYEETLRSINAEINDVPDIVNFDPIPTAHSRLESHLDHLKEKGYSFSLVQPHIPAQGTSYSATAAAPDVIADGIDALMAASSGRLENPSLQAPELAPSMSPVSLPFDDTLGSSYNSNPQFDQPYTQNAAPSIQPQISTPVQPSAALEPLNSFSPEPAPAQYPPAIQPGANQNFEQPQISVPERLPEPPINQPASQPASQQQIQQPDQQYSQQYAQPAAQQYDKPYDPQYDSQYDWQFEKQFEQPATPQYDQPFDQQLPQTPVQQYTPEPQPVQYTPEQQPAQQPAQSLAQQPAQPQPAQQQPQSQPESPVLSQTFPQASTPAQQPVANTPELAQNNLPAQPNPPAISPVEPLDEFSSMLAPPVIAPTQGKKTSTLDSLRGKIKPLSNPLKKPKAPKAAIPAIPATPANPVPLNGALNATISNPLPPELTNDQPQRNEVRKQFKKNTKITLLRDVVFIIVAAVLLSMVIKNFIFQPFLVPSRSMENTLQVQDRILVSRLTPRVFDIKRGDVVVFKDDYGWLSEPEHASNNSFGANALKFIGVLPEDNESYLVKRVIGLPGDHISCKGLGSPLIINGEEIKDEPYVPEGTDASNRSFNVTVPENSLFVMGDNRSNSSDSRFNTTKQGGGFVSESSVVGVVFAVAWPQKRIHGLENESGVFSSVPNP